jgi:hypothetical protein
MLKWIDSFNWRNGIVDKLIVSQSQLYLENIYFLISNMFRL